jgi:hypothetical protein
MNQGCDRAAREKKESGKKKEKAEGERSLEEGGRNRKT